MKTSSRCEQPRVKNAEKVASLDGADFHIPNTDEALVAPLPQSWHGSGQWSDRVDGIFVLCPTGQEL